MIIFPAIDLRNGKVVRLQQGRADALTQYSDDPVEVALRWQGEGAEWLHVVNLDGAFGDDASANYRHLGLIISAVQIPVQFGGGLRNIASVDKALDLGVTRIVLGTAAFENPELVADAVCRHGAERVAIGIDARDGMVAARGWREQSQVNAVQLGRQMSERGVIRIIYTDIARDGMLSGIDAGVLASFARATNLSVIASGGVASLHDIEALRTHEEIEGVIVGQALYTNALDLKEAIRAGKKNHSVS